MNATFTFQSAQNGNANGNVWDVSNFEAIGIHVVGSGFTGTVNFEGSIDGGTTWSALPMQGSAGTYASTATATGLFSTILPAFPLMRCRTSGVSAGNVTVTGFGRGH